MRRTDIEMKRSGIEMSVLGLLRFLLVKEIVKDEPEKFKKDTSAAKSEVSLGEMIKKLKLGLMEQPSERKDWLESAYERNFTNAYAEMPGMQEVSQKPEKTHIRCHICQVLPCVGLPRM